MTAVSPRPLHVRFFAILREQAGASTLEVLSTAANPAELYRELQASHRLTFDVALLRVAINDGYVSMDTPLNASDRVVFIPPVAGG